MDVPRVIPCLLLRGEGLVKTVRFKEPKYVGDSINAVRIYNDKEVDELIFLDITATRNGKAPRIEAIQNIASECFMPLCYGGGITQLGEVEEILAAGAEKVAINSACFSRPDLIRQASKTFGSQSIVASIDAKKNLLRRYELFSEGGSKKQRGTVVDHAKKMQDLGAGEILVTSIERDGTQSGYDLDLVQRVAQAVQVPVVACGGAGEHIHFRQAIDAGASAVAAGSLFVFHGKHRAVLITYPGRAKLEALFGS